MSSTQPQDGAGGEPQVVNEKLQKYLEKEEKSTRKSHGPWHWLAAGAMAVMVLTYYWSSGIQPLSAQTHRGVYVLLTYVLVFLLYPVGSAPMRWVLGLLTGVGLAGAGYAAAVPGGLDLLDGRLDAVAEALRDQRLAQALGAVGSLWGLAALGLALGAALAVADRWCHRRFPAVPGPLDLLLAAASVGAVAYWILQFEALAYRTGAELPRDFFVSLVGILLSLEVARRVLGWSMALVGVVFILYPLLGPYMPDVLAHRGFRFERVMNALYLTQDGVFGVMADVLATYVILFIFFGAFLQKSGAGRFFIDLPLALCGRTAGGPAKVAVIASALFGTVSGSAIANTVATGTFTIPMMKKAGFRPHVAGAIEPAASIGGMFMPPVMGAGGFLMAELTGIPYVNIMLMSVFPAFLYFLAVFTMVHFEAKKHGIEGVKAEDLPKASEILRREWYMVLPLGVIVALLLTGSSPGLSACWATMACIAVSWARAETRMGPREIWDAILSGARSTLVIGATVGVVGMVVGAIALTGIGLKFSDIIISLAGGNLAIAIILVGLASLVLGMGVPVTAAYLITAVLAVPALGDMGVMIVAAHQIVYWFSQDSNITPPVCVAAYAGAAIAGADPWKTGWTSFKFAKLLYVMPFLFAYTPAILIKNWDLSPPVAYPAIEVAMAFFSATVGTLAFSAMSMGYLVRRTTVLEWIFFAVATVLCYVPGLATDLTGIAMVGALWYWQVRKNRAEARGPAGSSPGPRLRAAA
ncbi:MAG: TRAP transporter permease [Deferrisomatales bacterium]